MFTFPGDVSGGPANQPDAEAAHTRSLMGFEEWQNTTRSIQAYNLTDPANTPTGLGEAYEVDHRRLLVKIAPFLGKVSSSVFAIVPIESPCDFIFADGIQLFVRRISFGFNTLGVDSFKEDEKPQSLTIDLVDIDRQNANVIDPFKSAHPEYFKSPVLDEISKIPVLGGAVANVADGLVLRNEGEMDPSISDYNKIIKTMFLHDLKQAAMLAEWLMRLPRFKSISAEKKQEMAELGFIVAAFQHQIVERGEA